MINESSRNLFKPDPQKIAKNVINQIDNYTYEKAVRYISEKGVMGMSEELDKEMQKFFKERFDVNLENLVYSEELKNYLKSIGFKPCDAVGFFATESCLSYGKIEDYFIMVDAFDEDEDNPMMHMNIIFDRQDIEIIYPAMPPTYEDIRKTVETVDDYCAQYLNDLREGDIDKVDFIIGLIDEIEPYTHISKPSF